MLQSIADTVYRVSNKAITIAEASYKTTICAMHLAPLGACKRVVLKSGPHSYICDACKALQHGKNSQLLHKFGHASKLNHPQTEQNRAMQQDVSNKYGSKKHLETALHNTALQNKTCSKKVL